MSRKVHNPIYLHVRVKNLLIAHQKTYFPPHSFPHLFNPHLDIFCDITRNQQISNLQLTNSTDRFVFILRERLKPSFHIVCHRKNTFYATRWHIVVLRKSKFLIFRVGPQSASKTKNPHISDQTYNYYSPSQSLHYDYSIFAKFLHSILRWKELQMASVVLFVQREWQNCSILVPTSTLYLDVHSSICNFFNPR